MLRNPGLAIPDRQKNKFPYCFGHSRDSALNRGPPRPAIPRPSARRRRTAPSFSSTRGQISSTPPRSPGPSTSRTTSGGARAGSAAAPGILSLRPGWFAFARMSTASSRRPFRARRACCVA
ncbi:MAG: hypothetical protein BJ554DRAFT_3251 [Olpidium bornovanus]|uniref:Uncharacterized protein n=1 Tax=Olpidium bornovanus TaxID=278681 RepID=A0A8H8DGC3_9FUNG|nr:MAG: hypothetical protein BJ554DRAFT_3251 [Olpidium bornovanus]